MFKHYAGHIVMIGGSCVRVPQHGANAQKGALPILARVVPVAACPQKIHPLLDADGRPGWLSSTEGHTADAAMAESSLSGLQPGTTLLADMACNTQAIRHFPRQRKAADASSTIAALRCVALSMSSIAQLISFNPDDCSR
ncbi:hypothetical protein FE840_018200 (plasmid) [Peteryoungia desertarenae]|uniref:Transposase n=1 Tax=Peteryoungia desertarenae TaxID=1813451 RepID=A0ABX6QTD8_9HYPH|nr:hypothetical protein [Peteryoungia desertarenae]QLF71587.1 hypothetical protein FE840_018200 [Peteryoungia desertarenae]